MNTFEHEHHDKDQEGEMSSVALPRPYGHVPVLYSETRVSITTVMRFILKNQLFQNPHGSVLNYVSEQNSSSRL